jgi:signal transduction histidine kinase
MRNTWSEFKRILLFIGVFGAVAGNLSDIAFNAEHLSLVIINSISAAIALAVLAVFLMNMIDSDIGNAVIVYVNLVNVFYNLLLFRDLPEIDLLVFRSSMLLGLLIMYGGFALNRYHSIVIGIIVFIVVSFITYYTGSPFLEKSLLLLTVILICFVLGINYILKMLDNYHLNQTRLIDDLNIRNGELVLQKNELHKLNHTKNKIFSVMAHDLRTPLNSIQGFSYLLIEGGSSISEKDSKTYIRQINDSTKKINALLEDILAWGRLQSGQINFNPKKQKISTLIQEVVDLLSGNAALKSIAVNVSIDDSLELMMDKNMILTVVRNLVSNAIKFTNKNGNIFIKTTVQQSKLYVAIMDTGIGMNESRLENLFASQFMESKNGTMNESGSGLGLVVCQEYVNLHKGKIWAKSKLGEGSVFTFTIPIS